MKGLFLAFLFATILASSTLITSDPQVSAQQGGATLVIRKIVEGLPPNSDWEFELDLNVQPYSTVITIDGGGGEATVVFAYTQVRVSVIERTKDNFIVYLINTIVGDSATQTHVVVIGTQRLIDQRDTVTVAFINRNNEQTPQPSHVGGVITPANKLALLSPYLALTSIVAVAAFVLKRRKN